jgi:hypothetical protein
MKKEQNQSMRRTSIHGFIFMQDNLQEANMIHTLPISLWFATANANKICFIGY